MAEKTILEELGAVLNKGFILDKGRIIEEGDIWFYKGGEWVDPTYKVRPAVLLGEEVQDGIYFRPYKVTKKPSKPKKQYRILSDNEIIKKGDQGYYRPTRGWWKLPNIWFNCKVSNVQGEFVNRFRRPINP